MSLKMKSLLLIDDEYYLFEYLQPYFKEKNIDLIYKNRLPKDHEQFDGFLIDLFFNNKPLGISYYHQLKDDLRPKAFLSSNKDLSFIENLYEQGLQNYYPKDHFLKEPEDFVQKIHYLLYEQDWIEIFSKKLNSRNISYLYGVFSLIKNPVNTLIQGPSGSGKNYLLQVLKEYLPKPFLELSSANISLELFESEFFGHKKGLFTGAFQDFEGKISKLDGGCLFLDEITCLSRPLQEKFLKLLSEKNFFPLGDYLVKEVDILYYSSTLEKDPLSFLRPDFYSKIITYVFKQITLEERKEDLDLLLNHFNCLQTQPVIFKQDFIEALKNNLPQGEIRGLYTYLTKKILQGTRIFTSSETQNL